MTSRFILLFSLCCALCFTFSACEREDNPNIHWEDNTKPDLPAPQPQPSPEPSPKPSPEPSPQPNPQPSPNNPSPSPALPLNAQQREDAARMEMPLLTGENGELFIVHRVANPQGRDSIVNYAYAYLPQSYHSRWVAFRFDAQTRSKTVGRKNYKIKPQYPRDPKLPTDWAIPSDLPFGRGYDHGHLVASADRLFSREANDQTFYMGNMSPQLSSFNQKYWTGLESLVQDLGRNPSFADTLYVVKGGTLTPLSSFGYAANGKMPVPHHYFMALLKVKNGVYSSIGFWVEHKNYGKNGVPREMGKHAVSISALEKLTGINFFHNLPDAVEQRVEQTLTLSSWTL
ncbi:MAG: DNA/RNA non-specific endonuclease [Alloprevotella sp.]|nr:MAG: DNA/RNA non-specific endonuclease [Alloprevotella sp.]